MTTKGFFRKRSSSSFFLHKTSGRVHKRKMSRGFVKQLLRGNALFCALYMTYSCSAFTSFNLPKSVEFTHTSNRISLKINRLYDRNVARLEIARREEVTMCAFGQHRSVEQSIVGEADTTAPLEETISHHIVDSFPQVDQNNVESSVSTVLYAASLIVANTVGSAILNCPDVVSKSGIIIPATVIVGTFILNIITSFYLSNYSISQFEAGKPAAEIPVSFKDMADESYGQVVGCLTTALTMVFNYCILVSNLIRFGDAAATMLPGSSVDAPLLCVGFAATLITLMGTSSNVFLSKVTSICVLATSVSFAGLVFPGLMGATWETFYTNSGGPVHTVDGGPDILSALIISGPYIVYCLEIQKIVPSVSKLCNFDRAKTTAALLLGQTVPFLMYISWAYAVLGGGVPVTMDSNGINGFLLPALTFASILGCTIAGSMSLSEEVTSVLAILKEHFQEKRALLRSDDDKSGYLISSVGSNQGAESFEMAFHDNIVAIEDTAVHSETFLTDKNVITEGEHYSTPAVLLAVIPPLLLGLKLIMGDIGAKEAIIECLDFCGGYITPIFIWLFPTMLAWKQWKEENIRSGTNRFFDLFPMSIIVLSSFAVIGLELTKDMTGFLSSFDG